MLWGQRNEHVQVKEAVVHRSYQGVSCRMGKAAQIAIRARRVDDDEINIPVERVDRIDKQQFSFCPRR